MKIVLLLLIFLVPFSGSFAQSATVPYLLQGGKMVFFVSASEAKNKIVEDKRSSYFSSLSYLDVAIRMQKRELPDKEAALTDYKRFIQNSVLDWQPEEITLLKKVLKDCQDFYSKVNPIFIPDTLYLIKTNGTEEAASDYTRDNSICLPQNRFLDLTNSKTHEKLGKIIIHELFHIYSRYQPAKKEQLYKAIGFNKIPQVTMGRFLRDRKLTNPDAPDYNYKINIKGKDNKEVEAILAVYSKYAAFEEGKDLKDHLTFALFEIINENGKYKILNGENPKPINPNEASGFWEQVGKNTNYIVHPDEILADNVRLLVLSKLDKSYIKHLDQQGMQLLHVIENILKE